jgi:hypothetical protein
MVFHATFNNISVISWQSVLLVVETRVLCMYSNLKTMVNTDWLFENMNPDIDPKWDVVRC